ncbi:MAG TPA: SRPBCC family protein [Polyangia bacterium]|jgi:ribosome-associated toxin RatA of RatAB toxin-antitoxin module|nr:SRPBCC family protein [Polyangia bacterium]
MHKPIIEVEVGADGTPASATATTRIAAPVARVWSHIVDVDRYPTFVPMMSKAKRDGDRVHVHLKFKITLFSVGFDFVADAKYEDGKWLDLRGVSGDIRDLHIRFELAEANDGSSTLKATISFDPFSLGWLSKYFLKHHPEIRYGLFPGCAYGLADSLRQASEK